MTGGLIQIVAYGAADVFLTGMPQITFFKIVYRRYTNFAIENIEQTFSGTKNFNNTISCTLDRVGDLVSRMYLKVIIPSVTIPNPNFVSTFNSNDQNDINNLQIQYTNFKTIMNFLYRCYRELTSYLKTINQTISLTILFSKIQQIVSLYFTSTEYSNLKSKYNALFNIKILINNFFVANFYDSNGNYLYGDSSLNNSRITDIDIVKNITNYSIASFSNSAALITKINADLTIFKNLSNQMDEYLFQNISDYSNLHKNYANYKFSWVKKLGHQIINNLFVEIGGQKIDQHNNDWYNIWNELSLNSELQSVYDKMIGNIDALTKYSYDIKTGYTMYIPLNFWFNKYISASLPLIFLRYNEVRIQLELNNVEKLIYTDAPVDTDFETMIQLTDISLLVDYIYLDVDERTKFSQSPQEYLIEVVQNYNYPMLTSNQITIESSFVNSVKELFWVAQSNKNLANKFYDTYDLGVIYNISSINSVPTTTLEQKVQLLIGKHVFNIGDTIKITNSQFYNGSYVIKALDLTSITIYSKFYVTETDSYVMLDKLYTNVTTFNDKNPIETSSYNFEQYERFQNYDSCFTNYVQPYTYHTKTPSDGINIYSFCLNPEEYQPSGAVNLSSYKYKSFVYQFNQKFIDCVTTNSDAFMIKTYALGYNILSFKNGMAGLVFNI